MYRCTQKLRRAKAGFTLLETIMAISLAALLMSPVVGMLRTCRGLWVQIQDDSVHADSLHSTLRHLSRNLRTAAVVTFVESGSGRSAQLQILDSDGQVCGWKHDARTGEVQFSSANASGLLATNIDELVFEAFDETGRITKDSRLIRMVRCSVTTNLKRTSHATRSATCTVWIRPAI